MCLGLLARRQHYTAGAASVECDIFERCALIQAECIAARVPIQIESFPLNIAIGEDCCSLFAPLRIVDEHLACHSRHVDLGSPCICLRFSPLPLLTQVHL